MRGDHALRHTFRVPTSEPTAREDKTIRPVIQAWYKHQRLTREKYECRTRTSLRRRRETQTTPWTASAKTRRGWPDGPRPPGASGHLYRSHGSQLPRQYGHG